MSQCPSTPHRRGTIYLLVLVTTMIITVIGIIGFNMMRAQSRVAAADVQRDEAAVMAESGVQWGIHMISLKPDWRTAFTSGTDILTMAVGQGDITVALIDDDGDLADNPLDPFWIRSKGVVGDAEQTLETQIELPATQPHPAILESLTVGGTLYINEDDTLYLESGGTALDERERDGDRPDSYRVTRESPVDFPDTSLVQLWAGKGTVIPRSVHGGKFSGVTLSKTQAPAGVTPDPNGIYVIDAEGQNFIFDKSYVTGTLVIINTGTATIDLIQSRFWFGDHGGPTLITDGQTRLSLTFWVGVQQGIFYIDGPASIEQDMMSVGTMIVTGDLTVKTGYISFNDHPGTTSGPPEGFHKDEGYRVVEGSWRRIVN